MKLTQLALEKDMAQYFAEDDLSRNLFYMKSLPEDQVSCDLYIKSDLVLAGLPWFQAAFHYLGESDFAAKAIHEYEGKRLKKGTKISLGQMSFAKALTGERIALNLLQRASNIATYTSQYVEKADKYNISILDTRKTTPGLRMLEKYAVRVGGGKNHRFGQTDLWMVKDNHKTFFGGVREAIQFFKDMGSFYNEIELEVHSEKEFEEALELGVRHVMLDNFSPEMIKNILPNKKEGMTIEVSGGVRLSTLDKYLIQGVDAISVGALTYDAPAVDISFKYQRI
ncbi:MAG: nicotinate-nucleotide diphosphorylase (carboxylating) [Halobacteriovoraceae bacterium]|jgi:nicotinate-nucleotide pyrophosphorylase (carboxylating)|nr:nicotinate-nucleotide diphosphorylase (carboxylating) [Halobacteriovoraceae bacterium]MBC98521.1 nicotinate-nucleotide diphosphorylase (carboxylating) [Halobacteriovoraceae bacterium]|tara:strand:- start:4217 stop:5062 length:846 start_codon:yes stop_codon:yes gene_type:complete